MLSNNHPSEQEYTLDQQKMRRLKERIIEIFGRKMELHVSKATCWGDRWRIPVFFNMASIRIDAKHYKSVQALGATLVVEESYNDEEGMNKYIIEMPRSKLRGLYAWSRSERYIFLFVFICLGISVYHLFDYVRRIM